ncbi:phosphotransferase enzyme family protein [Brevibacillus reuszeri]|uniref:phosphotransferase enzyme family protein n=1 Tax=Brevibacillus reuszeri TaxID=54915 RepID=UPI000673274E|nr:phosphotransferase [Brevibacillus reuszeri]MED1858104.1 phosphotransferase [Brevibacillus reuszeri]
MEDHQVYFKIARVGGASVLPHIQRLYTDHILKEGLRRYGVTQEDVRFLGGFDSYVYEYTKNNASFILKISHSTRRSESEIHGEMDWLHYLGKNGVSVAKSIPSDQGHLVEVIGERASYFTAVAYEKAPGQLPTKVMWNESFFEEWGRITGKLHALSKSYQASNPAWKRKEWYEEEHVNLQRFIPSDQKAVIAKSNDLLDRLKNLPKDKDMYGMIHGDLHLHNFHAHAGAITLFDFDDSAYHYFVYDIAVVLFYAFFRPLQQAEDKQLFIREFFASFLKGYRQENDFPTEWLAYLPDFLKLRHLILYVVFLQTLEGQEMEAEDRVTMDRLRRVIEEEWPIIDVDFRKMK